MYPFPASFSHLIKDLTNISLRLSKPHGQKFRSFDGNEVGLALIGNGLGQESFTTTWRPIEQHTLGWSHTKLQEFVRMLHWVLKGIRKSQLSDNVDKSYYESQKACMELN